jgi:hypothetical protein
VKRFVLPGMTAVFILLCCASVPAQEAAAGRWEMVAWYGDTGQGLDAIGADTEQSYVHTQRGSLYTACSGPGWDTAGIGGVLNMQRALMRPGADADSSAMLKVDFIRSYRGWKWSVNEYGSVFIVFVDNNGKGIALFKQVSHAAPEIQPQMTVVRSWEDLRKAYTMQGWADEEPGPQVTRDYRASLPHIALPENSMDWNGTTITVWVTTTQVRVLVQNDREQYDTGWLAHGVPGGIAEGRFGFGACTTELGDAVYSQYDNAEIRCHALPQSLVLFDDFANIWNGDRRINAYRAEDALEIIQSANLRPVDMVYEACDLARAGNPEQALRISAALTSAQVKADPRLADRVGDLLVLAAEGGAPDAAAEEALRKELPAQQLADVTRRLVEAGLAQQAARIADGTPDFDSLPQVQEAVRKGIAPYRSTNR